MDELELNLPKKALVNKFIAKTKFYDKATLGKKLKEEFIDKIQKITWKYKLAEDTIGIEKTDSVIEIQVFQIELKEQVIPKNVLKLIDKFIPYPILYQFIYKNNFAYGINLKNSDIGHDYYFSDWNIAIKFDFNAINLEKLYQKLIQAFIDDDIKQQGDFETVITTDQQIKRLESEIQALGSKVKREKQFNRQLELNKILQEKQKQMDNIKGESNGNRHSTITNY
jgi:hypothetical protein